MFCVYWDSLSSIYLFIIYVCWLAVSGCNALYTIVTVPRKRLTLAPVFIVCVRGGLYPATTTCVHNICTTSANVQHCTNVIVFSGYVMVSETLFSVCRLTGITCYLYLAV